MFQIGKKYDINGKTYTYMGMSCYYHEFVSDSGKRHEIYHDSSELKSILTA